MGYEASLAEEIRLYENCENVHSLPDIFHYWTNRHICPELLSLGVANQNDLFRKYLEERCDTGNERPKRFVSLGSGNCDFEIDLALALLSNGHSGFIFDCVDLNPAMLERGLLAARTAGVGSHFAFCRADLNNWNPSHEYDAALANQSLHHVVNLDGLFAEVKRSLRHDGCFVISDMIGRNGHERWPEALEIVHEFWRKLPPSYRCNRVSGGYEELYESRDCSVEGFEGVRSQDILPLLLREFHFRFFFPFGNAIDPFVDRAFGPNFDPALEWDRNFIDQLHRRDERELASGRLKPTHLLAVVTKENGAALISRDHLLPKLCVRTPEKTSRGALGRVSSPVNGSSATYLWGTWPHTAQSQLEIACERLAESAHLVLQRSAWALTLEAETQARADWAFGLENELKERTSWALSLDREVAERTAWALRLEEELAERTTWTLRLEEELAEQTARLEAELAERTAWALETERELAERTAWSLLLRAELEEQNRRRAAVEKELSRYLRNPLKFGLRIAAGLLNRIRRSTLN